jgi:hypothetical protein
MQTTIQFVPKEATDAEIDSGQVCSAEFDNRVVRTYPEYEFADAWNVCVADSAQPTEHPVFDEEHGDNHRYFDTREELIEWMAKFSMVPVFLED